MTYHPIPYVFVWSENYKVFADCLKKSVQTYPSIFTDESQHIPQTEFDKSIYKIDGHFLNGCFIKLEKTLECLYTFPENSYFIFSDADIILFPNKQLPELINFYRTIEADIVFMRESLTNPISNIGFSLIRVNDHTRALFQTALQLAQQDPTSLDQTVVNKALQTFSGSHYYFPSEFVMTSSTMMEFESLSWNSFFSTIRPNCMVFQPLCNPTQTKEEVFQVKLSQYKQLNIDIE